MKKFTLIVAVIFASQIFAQDITNKLGGNTSSETYDITDSNNNVLLRVRGDGKTGIGTDSPDEILHIDGNLRLDGTFEDKDGDAGTSSQILSSTGTGTDWIDLPSAHDAVSIGTANGLSLITQVLSLATATTSSAGAMSSTDKTKLDGLSSGGNTLDQAYDQGGAGAGSTITADAGAFNVGGVDGALFTGTLTSGTLPASGAGTRMMWYPKRAAFRVGGVSGTQWDDTNIGDYSTAMGLNTTASGLYSTAMGSHTTASNLVSTAMGYYTTASGQASTAMGYYTTASGQSSIAMGSNTTASGYNSTAMGLWTTASGAYSTAMGHDNYASGNFSTAMGNYVSTNTYEGSFIIGDLSGSSTDITESSANNQMTMIFTGGYRLFTNDAASTGATLASGANSWGSVSDSTKKENYLKTDGEYFLNSIAQLRLGSWNYKGQDAKDFRHYGPMAQEIFHYFGKDEFGTIGNDTTLATADMDGIIMIAIQALIKENEELKARIERLENQ